MSMMVVFTAVYWVPISLGSPPTLITVLRVSFILKDDRRAFVFVIRSHQDVSGDW